MKYTDGKNIMVYVETAAGTPVNAALEILGKASQLAQAGKEEVLAVLAGTDLEAVASAVIEAGADQVLISEQEDTQAETVACVLAALAEKYHPARVFMAATQNGKAIAPALAGKCGSGCATDVVGITESGAYTCPSYNGNVLYDLELGAVCPQVATIRSGSFSKCLDSGRKGTVIKETVEIAQGSIRTKIMETVQEIAEAVNLEEAEVIVSGGRGMGSKENFELVKELATVCGGVVGATRPAIEGEWISRAHQVGQSGKIVAPKLYIACGISGATQHVSGMIGSNYIVAINKDEDAPIFDVADVGIVGDVMQVLPLMIEEMKKKKAQ